jgi:hypothetical protein
VQVRVGGVWNSEDCRPAVDRLLHRLPPHGDSDHSSG